MTSYRINKNGLCVLCQMNVKAGGFCNGWHLVPCSMGEVTSPSRERDELLEERQKTHGAFEDNARISQALKLLFTNEGSGDLCDVHREALDMIALELSRILSGKADYKDHWRDIARYAKLGEEKASK